MPEKQTHYRIVCLLSILIALSCACTQPAQKKSAPKVTDTAAKKSTVVTQSVADSTDCPRGAAEPVVKKEVFQDAKFNLEPDARTGIETATLPDGDKMTIKQTGCEYYVLIFTFETSRFAADTADISYWGNATLKLLGQASKGLKTPLEIDQALKKLAARLQNDPQAATKLALNEEIDFGGPDPRQYLTIERVTAMANKRFALTVSLSYGPM